MTVIFPQCDQNIKDLFLQLRKNLGVRGTLSVQPLITSLGVASSIKQCWFADDAWSWLYTGNQEMVGHPQHPWPRLKVFSQRQGVLNYLKGKIKKKVSNKCSRTQLSM